MENRDKLRELLLDVFLLAEVEFRFDLMRDEIDTWDSLGLVTLAVGVDEVFGYHFTPEEATAISGVDDIIRTLERNGISFQDAT